MKIILTIFFFIIFDCIFLLLTLNIILKKIKKIPNLIFITFLIYYYLIYKNRHNLTKNLIT